MPLSFVRSISFAFRVLHSFHLIDWPKKRFFWNNRTTIESLQKNFSFHLLWELYQYQLPWQMIHNHQRSLRTLIRNHKTQTPRFVPLCSNPSWILLFNPCTPLPSSPSLSHWLSSFYGTWSNPSTGCISSSMRAQMSRGSSQGYDAFGNGGPECSQRWAEQCQKHLFALVDSGLGFLKREI